MLPTIARMGTLDATPTNAGTMALTWAYGPRKVWLAEVPLMGRKRALYVGLKDARIVRRIERLEAEAAAIPVVLTAPQGDPVLAN